MERAEPNVLPGPWAGLLSGVAMEPRPYQLRIIASALEMFAGRHRNRVGELEPEAQSVMIESPTGSGKTVMGLAIARALQQRHGWSVGWVAMRRNLLAQAAAENERRGLGVPLQLISMFDKRPPPVDLLVVDEAQHDAAMSMANLHCDIRPKKVLGMTATPFRTDRIKLCFDKVIRDAGIHRLIQDGYLSRYRHYTIPQYDPATVAGFLAADPQRWGKSLVFFHRQEQCDRCRCLLAARGVRAEVVTAKSNRQRQLADFADRRFDVLINMSILTEGFDCPDLQTVFCRPSGRGCTIQMAGRVFRRHEGLPCKQIVQCRKTRHPFIRTAMADEQYVWADDVWQSLAVNRQINAVSERVRRIIAQSQVELPQLVAAHRARSVPWRRGEDDL